MNVRRLRYDEQHYPSADECLTGIGSRVRWGWQVSDVRGYRHGYLVTFRLQVDADETVEEPPSAGRAGGPP